MKRIISLVAITWLINGCNSTEQATGDFANCPTPPTSPPSFQVSSEHDFYNNLQSVDILATEDTITFQTLKYDLIFCRPNQTWIVQPGTYQPPEPPPKDYEAALIRLGDPPYQTLELDGKTYQYRVLLDPNPFPDFQTEPKQVVLELIKPEETEPQRQTLYTLEQVKEKKTGIQLGIPSITASIIYNNRLYWSISPEQGEGNGGIATIASYDPKTDKIKLIQPAKLAKQQIKDLVIAGEPEQPIFWMATQMSGEGNPYLPGMGLVAYRPDTKSLKIYHHRNSPLIGSIPHQLHLDDQLLWVGTGNGLCEVKWQSIDTDQSWQCWQFSLQAKLPNEEFNLYPSLLASTAKTTLKPSDTPQGETEETVEVLWWSSFDQEKDLGRYEVVYQPGLTISLKDQGVRSWQEFYHDSRNPEDWQSPVYWIGKDWQWSGDRFIRPFDGVSLNSFGGGPTGISTWNIPQQSRPENYAIRGDLDLINLTKNTTEVKYYSAWVDDNLLNPYLTIIPVQKPQQVQKNPLDSLASVKVK
ncbi:MAG TPA: hypothetical protein DCF68_08285 [Cyanothece sp. UBA12306]|nr:hypothetical protein [Cyanothece sp. UBA12306]